ncbi:MAG: Wzz/FepE/Etk N-terminal domain-containing protein [Candidatus Sulfotelmatobacter sp.]
MSVNQDPVNSTAAFGFSLRDIVTIVFRHKRVVILSFLGILTGAVLAAVLHAPEYRASTKFLIERERLDPVISPGESTPPESRGEVTEEELNSEVELIESADVLRQVVVSCGLDQKKSFLGSLFGAGNDATRIAKAAKRLQSDLKIEVVRKSNVISVSYTADDPQLAARVLSALGDAYLKKNVAVHRPPGQFEFFDQETQAYRKNLADAESKLKTFSSQEGGVAPQMARDITLQKLSEFRASLQQTRADIAGTEERIRALEKQAGSTPQRLTTSASQTDDAQVLQGLKATLMTLELKRTELLTKYQPTYALVQEVDKEIADAKASIVTEEDRPIRQETTDRNPTYNWINEELAKAKADYSGLQARAAATQAIVSNYEAKAEELDQKGLVQQDLLRTMKTDEENYLMYQRKREEARMTNALDQTRILNVAIAEQPIAPTLPSNSPWTALVVGLMLAVIVSLGTAFGLDYMDTSFRTPEEVVSELNVPVLGTISLKQSGFQDSWNGNGNGNGRADIDTRGERSGEPEAAEDESTSYAKQGKL